MGGLNAATRMKAVCLGGDFYVPENKILHVFPYRTNMAKKIVAEFRDKDNTRVFDCTGRRMKSSVIVIQGGPSGDHIVLSPLTAKTIAKVRAAD